jgi:hypothetical protein
MASRLRQLPAPSDSETVRLQKLTSALLPSLDPDVQRQVTPLPSDTPADAAHKFQRATAEAVALIVDRSVKGRRTFNFTTPATTFPVPHNLGVVRPTVVITNSAGRKVYCGIRYLDSNNLVVDSGAAFACTIEVSL